MVLTKEFVYLGALHFSGTFYFDGDVDIEDIFDADDDEDDGGDDNGDCVRRNRQ